MIETPDAPPLPGQGLRKIDVLAALLEVYTVEQLQQIADASQRVQAENEQGQQADVIIRFKGMHPRWVGIGPMFAEMQRPGKEVEG